MFVLILSFLSNYIGKFVSEFRNVKFCRNTHFFFMIKLSFLRTIELLHWLHTFNFSTELCIFTLIHFIIFIKLINMILHDFDIIIYFLQTITFCQKFILFWINFCISFSNLTHCKIKLEVKISNFISCLQQLIFSGSHLEIICTFSSHCII